jgi:hypothetical protein
VGGEGAHGEDLEADEEERAVQAVHMLGPAPAGARRTPHARSRRPIRRRRITDHISGDGA